MATDPKFDAIYEQIASRAVAGNQSKFDTSAFLAQYRNNQQPGAYKPTDVPKSGWSLGQSLIDILSASSSYVAGVGKQAGEGVSAISRGDILGGAARLNPIGLAVGGVTEGVNQRRSWSDNLKDLGVGEGPASGWGLALDIALDPLWLVPGGAIAAGIKGTTRGAVSAAGATRAGVTYSKEAFEEASKRLTQARTVDGKTVLPNTEQTVKALSPMRATQADITADLFPATGIKGTTFSGTGARNLYEGIRQGNIENYAEWAALRRVDKAAKAVRKDTKKGSTTATEKFQNKFNIDPRELLFGTAAAATKAADEVLQGTSSAAAKPELEADIPNVAADAAQAVEEVVESKASTKLAKDIEKDADAAKEAAENVIEASGASAVKSVNAQAREVLDPYKQKFLSARGMDAPAVSAESLAKVTASPIADDIAEDYDKLISDPTNPEVIASFSKLSEEVEDQFDFLTRDPDGPQISVKFVDEDPYQIDGKPSSKLFMEDIVNNKQLLVYRTQEGQTHPILSNDINDKFRAVHDFFGHAASGRGVAKDGEEAAWISHSTMFSELARKAMTTETRGQNSWVNRYGLDEAGKPVKYAEQKAALLPDAYTMLPAEYARVENQVVVTNGLIARTASIIEDLNDRVLDFAGMVSSPLKGFEYTQKDFAAIRKVRDQITDSQLVKPGSPEHGSVIETLTKIKERVSGGTRLNRIAEDIQEMANSLSGEAGLAFRKVLNTPTDATDLLVAAAKAEGRNLDLPPAFKPIEWAPKAGYSKPGFSIKDIEKYFPNDPLLNDAKNLELAMGAAGATKVRAMKGETKEQALARRQALIWEDFRVRNADLIPDVDGLQKAEWDATYSTAVSDVFVNSKGIPIGKGKLPLGIPSSAIGSADGIPTVNLAKLLSSIQSTIIREPIRATQGLGSLDTVISSALAKKVNVTRKILDEEGRPIKLDELFSEIPSDQVLTYATSTVRGARFEVADINGAPIPNLMSSIRAGEGIPAGAQLVAKNDAAKEVLVKLRRLKSDIEIDRIPPVIKDWVSKKLDTAIANTSKSSVRVSRSVDQMLPEEVAALAQRLKDAVPSIKSFDDAKVFISNFDGAIASLAKKPRKKIYVKKEELLPYRGARKAAVPRDEFSGMPIPGGKPFPLSVNDVDTSDQTILAASGKQFTGRAPARGAARDKMSRPYESQFAGGKEQLASVTNVAKAIDTISGAISSRELRASPEQASLLKEILGTLGRKIAPDASPQQVFDEFQKNSRILYEDLIKGIESAAKKEAVIAAAPRAFSKSIEENIAIIEAIEKTDPGELQRTVMQLTTDAVALVDEACRLNSTSAGSAPAQFLERVITGL